MCVLVRGHIKKEAEAVSCVSLVDLTGTQIDRSELLGSGTRSSFSAGEACEELRRREIKKDE